MSETGEFRQGSGQPIEGDESHTVPLGPLNDDEYPSGTLPGDQQEASSSEKGRIVSEGSAESIPVQPIRLVLTGLTGLKKKLPFMRAGTHGLEQQDISGSETIPDERALHAAGTILGSLTTGEFRNNGHKLHIAIEGIDGTGKSTAFENVEQLLLEKGLSVSTVRYTNKSGIMGKVISSLYSQPDHNSTILQRIARFRPFQTAMYATNGRVNLLKRQKGTDVLLADRSILSGYASHIGRVPNWLLNATESTYAPDVVAYLDLPLDEAARRISVREEGTPGYEEDAESLLRFRDDYERVFANPPHRLRKTTLERIDASLSKAEVAETIAQIALQRLASS